MKKAYRISMLIIGIYLLCNTILMAVIANFNIGLVPVAGLGIVFTAYSILMKKREVHKMVHAVMAGGLAIVLVFGSFLAIYGRRDNVTYKEETIIVLGCGIRGERVSVGLAKRLDKAAEYHKKNPDATIIVSGGQGPQEDIPEALAMKRYLVNLGIDEDKIIMEDKSISTITNFRNSHNIMKKKGLPSSSVAFVTNGYHVYRSANYAAKEGLEVTHLGTDIIWYTIPMNYLREMLAVMKMWVFD